MSPLNLQQEKSQPSKIFVGVDEAGRGAWAGPVVAAAVIWPSQEENLEINDSKQLTPLARERLFLVITQRAVAYGVGMASSKEIDKYGIAPATHMAMQRAVGNLSVSADLILVDGYKVNFEGVESMGVIGGDGIYLPIAAASILAKVTRDRLMTDLHKKYPRFGFAIHKGYGTALHQERLAKYGASAVHRKSFAPIKARLEQTIIETTI